MVWRDYRRERGRIVVRGGLLVRKRIMGETTGVKERIVGETEKVKHLL